MKKIITALANPKLNNYLKKENEFELIADDIQYQDGILEILSEKEAEILIMSELLKGQYNLKELLKKIKQKNSSIKIILILEKENFEKIKIAEEEKVDKIFFHHKVSVEEMIFNIKEISSQKNIEEEIEYLKKLIIDNKHEKNIKKEKLLKIRNKIKKQFKVRNNQTDNLENKIIAVTGPNGVGKSLITSCFALNIKNKKILLVDFDLLNLSIHTILGEKTIPKKVLKKIKNNYNYKSKNYSEYILKINSSLDFFSGKNIIFENNKTNFEKLNLFFESIKNKYDLILIDTSSEGFYEYTKFILEKSNLIVFLTEANLSEIKKANNLLNIYLRDWNIDNNKIKIVFNKYSKNSIDEKILKSIFADFNILGKISFNKKYSLMINKNMKNYFFLKKEKIEHEKILNNIFNKNFKGGILNGRIGINFRTKQKYAKRVSN